MPEPSGTDYLPIAHHGVIGNLRTAALVGLDGAISWWCAPFLDSASVFAALLDHRRGGRFAIRPTGGGAATQRYLDDTNVLETSFVCGGGRLSIVDSMPISGPIDGCCPDAPATPEIHRSITAHGGTVEVLVEWSPRLDYARAQMAMRRAGDSWLAWSADGAVGLGGLEEGSIEDDGVGPVLRARLEVPAGSTRHLVTRLGVEPVEVADDVLRRALDATTSAWRSWVRGAEAEGSRSWADPHAELVVRSELVLKLLTSADSGAIAAAVTTSLPEEIGGVRNWDYRYAWIRDASMAAQALYGLGHRHDARAFIQWVERTAHDRQATDGRLQILYSLHGRHEVPEQELASLEGYRGSAPVRIGNLAGGQLQLDIYGELVSAAYELARHEGGLEESIATFISSIANEACRHWTEPDHGPWEVRHRPKQHVYAKAMVWMALERALRMHRSGAIDGDASTWEAAAHAIREEVLRDGVDPSGGHFMQSYGVPVVDASNLVVPILGLLPFDDPRVRRTVERVRAELETDGLVRRYVADDGIAGGEGAFGLCSFWLIDVLTLSGQVEEAAGLFDAMAGRANHLGLFAEQIDPRTGEHLGNFPQAFTHIGLVNSAIYLAHARGVASPVSQPVGTDRHRADSPLLAPPAGHAEADRARVVDGH